MPKDEDLFRGLMREDLASFAKRSIAEVLPGVDLEWNWHLDLICDRLTRLASGEIKLLLICVPPRSLKSLLCSVVFPAWLMGRNEGERVLCISYAQPLAEDFARQCRQLMDANFYKAVFETRLSNDRRAVEQFETTGGGGRITSSVHGTITGRGGDIIILDDPMKPEEARSEVGSKSVLDWMQSTLTSRSNSKKNSRQLVIMQRLAENDVAGSLIEQGGWEQVILPAIAMEDEEHHYEVAGIPVVTRRAQGQALQPHREPIEVLEQLRSQMGNLTFSAQYQQDPIPTEGNLVKRSWFGTYAPAELLQMERVIASWDCASKTLDSHDYSVGITAGIKNGKIYIIDVFRAKLEMPELVRAVIEQAEKYNPERVLIEDKAAGTGLLQALRAAHFYKGVGIVPKGDKMRRFSAVTPMIEGGHVLLPEHAPWKDDYLHEVCGFPVTKRDDQVDATSQLLFWIQESAVPGPLYEYMRMLHGEGRAEVEDPTVQLRWPENSNRFIAADGKEHFREPSGVIWVTPVQAASLRLIGFADVAS
jgi:predicted phage terminase large subunit-like protein